MSDERICTCDADALMKWDDARECYVCCDCGLMIDESRWNDDEDYEDYGDCDEYGFW